MEIEGYYYDYYTCPLISYIKLQNLAILLILRNRICSVPIKWKNETKFNLKDSNGKLVYIETLSNNNS